MNGLVDVRITAGPYELEARWEREKSPRNCEAFGALLPYRQRIIRVRWSGESCWIPLGDLDFGVGFEDATSYPGRYSCTQGATRRRRSYSPTVPRASRASSANSRATTSSW
jgi:hypothetical protein